MLANKKGRYGGNRSALTDTSCLNFNRPCYCRSSGTCVTCAWWAHIGRRLHAWRARGKVGGL